MPRVYRPHCGALRAQCGRHARQTGTIVPRTATLRLSRALRQARSGRCRSCAARARPLILHGFQSLIIHADGCCCPDRPSGSVFTPHASLMQYVPCLPLAGPFGEIRGQIVPRGCWTERIARAMRDSAHPQSSQDPVRPAPIHDRYAFRIPVPDRVLSGELRPMSYRDHRVLSEHTALSPSDQHSHSRSMRSERHARLRIRMRKFAWSAGRFPSTCP